MIVLVNCLSVLSHDDFLVYKDSHISRGHDLHFAAHCMKLDLHVDKVVLQEENRLTGVIRFYMNIASFYL